MDVADSVERLSASKDSVCSLSVLQAKIPSNLHFIFWNSIVDPEVGVHVESPLPLPIMGELCAFIN